MSLRFRTLATMSLSTLVGLGMLSRSSCYGESGVGG